MFSLKYQLSSQLIGPPIGGALYTRFGYRAPFIFSEIFTVLDLVGRLLVIERKKSLLWKVNPTSETPCKHNIGVETAVIPRTLFQTSSSDVERNLSISQAAIARPHAGSSNGHSQQTGDSEPALAERSILFEDGTAFARDEPLLLLAVLVKLSRSPRALIALWITLTHA